MNIALLQLPALGMSSSRLDYYISAASSKNVKLVVLGEYVLNPFFKELETLSISMIKEQSAHQINVLKNMAKKYNIFIVASVVIVKKSKPYKVIAKVAPTSISYYEQQALINYDHWNEEKFFANDTGMFSSGLVFKVGKFKFAVMSGFELHFDDIWLQTSRKNVDAVLIPSVSTFGSHNRWRELLKIRAFTHNVYVARANRVGEYKDGKYSWQFYGDSMVSDPNGEIVASLKDTEELLIFKIDKKVLKDSRDSWKFTEAIKNR